MIKEVIADNSVIKENDQPFVAEGGISLPIPVPADPYAALDDLMKVVEALCPIWPERETFKEGSYWLL